MTVAKGLDRRRPCPLRGVGREVVVPAALWRRRHWRCSSGLYVYASVLA